MKARIIFSCLVAKINSLVKTAVKTYCVKFKNNTQQCNGRTRFAFLRHFLFSFYTL